MKNEKTITPFSGYAFMLLLLFIMIAAIGLYQTDNEESTVVLLVLVIFLASGMTIVSPNNAKVLLLFGDYKGTLNQNGLFWVNPFFKKLNISLRARNFESEKIKVNDKLGNPILISVILVWKVKDTFKASFEVDNYEHFVRVQTDSAVRKLAGSYPYDHFGDDSAVIALSTNFDDVNQALEQEIVERMQIAGIDVIESRIAYLAYAPEIAHSMLRRQQASAIVAARHKIVEGAVGMVESALALLSEKDIIVLDEEKKAAMVSNLLVVLCGDKDTQPVVNTGTLHQ
ncbi:SPFH domain-containing protein [Daejeonella sp.]|uniref:SPFH domain-containing protein n=1 Tax=Daejeonella sp. TaxID=2805397 RepID=UPI0030C076BC